jgi:putative spermidine/putrescine transport system permease protein
VPSAKVPEDDPPRPQGRAAAWRGGPLATPLLLVAPAVILYVVLLVIPFANLFLSSFYGYSRTAGVVKVLSLANYQRIWLDSFYLDIILRTFRVSLITTAATLIVGYPVALYMSRAGERARGLITLAILSPLLVSVVVRSFGWLVILGRNGLLDSLFALFGIHGVNFMYTEAAMVIGMVNVFMPYLVLSVAASLQSISPALPLAAASLGANRWKVFRRVVFPLSLPGVTVGSVIVFCLASSAFVTPAMLGGAELKVMSVLAYQQTMVLQNWPLAAAIAFSLLVIVLGIIALQVRLMERGRAGMVLH